MSWFSKSFLPTVIGGVGGFLMGGYADAAVGAGLGAYSGYQTDKTEREQKKAAKKMEEEMAKNEVKPTIVDDSRQQEERRKRNQLKQGSASTVLAGDYRQSAAKRLLGE